MTPMLPSTQTDATPHDLLLAELLPDAPTREQIVRLQEAMAPHGCAIPEPVHRFAAGQYLRELTVPAGMLIVGKIHRYEHFLIVLSGRAIVVSEFGRMEVSAGHISVSPAGVKRVVLALEDTRFLTVHNNADDCRDLVAIESRHIEPEAADTIAQTSKKESLQ